jgi:hypothetical protein
MSSTVVGRIALEADGPLTVGQASHPHTRQTVLAEVTAPAGSTTACLTTNYGADEVLICPTTFRTTGSVRWHKIL